LNHPRNLLRNPPDPNANPRNHLATKLTPPSSTPHNKPSTPLSTPPLLLLPPQHLSHSCKMLLLQLNHPCHHPPSQPVSPESQQASHQHSIPWPQESTTSNYTAPQQTPYLPRYYASAPNVSKNAMPGIHSNDSLSKEKTANSALHVYHAPDHARIWGLYSEHLVGSSGDSHRTTSASTFQVSQLLFAVICSPFSVFFPFICSFRPALCGDRHSPRRGPGWISR
jgi:hypothetical protein